MPSNETVIKQTRSWVKNVIIGLNFCPFAKPEYDRGSIRFNVIGETELEPCLQALISECQLLDTDDALETTLLMFPNSFINFDDFLDFIEIANALLIEQNYEGVYQLANFHPDYCFADVTEEEPANYTNRSPYPMLHIIREASLERALLNYPEPELIPERNIELARARGLSAMQSLLAACYNEK